MHSWKWLALLSASALVVFLSACPVPFGYYTAGNEVVKEVQTSETSTAVPVATPIFTTVAVAGGTPEVVAGEPSRDSDQVISLSCDTKGALIYYTYTIETGTPSVPATPDPYKPVTQLYDPTKPILVRGNGTVIHIKAIAFKALMLPSSVADLQLRVSYTTASSPTFVPSPPASIYNASFTLTINASTPGSTVWYTLDGTTPVVGGGGTTQSGTAPVSVLVDRTTRVRAVATAPDYSASNESTALYTFQVLPPILTAAGGTKPLGDSFDPIIDVQTAGSTIWYTTDGNDPAQGVGTEGGSSVSLHITASTDVKAIAVKPGWNPSPVASEGYHFVPVAPTLSVGGVGVGSVTLTWNQVATATGYVIYYRQGSTVTTSTGTRLTGVSSPQTFGGLAGGSQYAFIVAAVNPYGEGAAGATVVAVPLLTAPTGLTAASVSTAGFYLTWNSLANASTYKLWSDTSAGGTFTTLEWSGTGTSAVVGTFPASQTVYFKIQGVDVAGSPGGLSSAIASTTLPQSSIPVAISLPTGSYPLPTELPQGAPSPDYWIRNGTLAFAQGPYTYLVWYKDYQNSSAFAISAYDINQTLVNQWVIYGNRYITSFTIDSGTGDITFVGQSGTTVVAWSTLQM